MNREPSSNAGLGLAELAKTLLAKRSLFLVSNRGPIEYIITPGGQLQARRTSGGVIGTLTQISQHTSITWVASAMGEGDRRAVETSGGAALRSPLPRQKMAVKFVVVPRRVYHKYYNVICNPLLWFLQHHMWNPPYTPNVDGAVYDSWQNGYVLMNRSFAEALIAEAPKAPTPPVVMIQDYHLYLVAGYIRKALPDAILQHFVHIPWPSARHWQLLPREMRDAIFQSLLANDMVGFQTRLDLQNFLSCCQFLYPEAQVDHSNQRVAFQNHQTLVKHYPTSIDPSEIRRIASSPRVLEYVNTLSSLCGEKTIIRVDQTEPSRNIIRGFRAFQLLLQKEPSWVGRVKFLAFLVPSRTHIKQFQRYMEEVNLTANEINQQYGSEGSKVVEIFSENNFAQALAAMKLYDVLLVNTVVDGMNLVAKEGPVVNTKDGVLVLSETSGAYDQLRSGALGVAPADIEGTANALLTALNMTPDEKRSRAETLGSSIEREDSQAWLCHQLEDIAAFA